MFVRGWQDDIVFNGVAGGVFIGHSAAIGLVGNTVWYCRERAGNGVICVRHCIELVLPSVEFVAVAVFNFNSWERLVVSHIVSPNWFLVAFNLVGEFVLVNIEFCGDIQFFSYIDCDGFAGDLLIGKFDAFPSGKVVAGLWSGHKCCG